MSPSPGHLRHSPAGAWFVTIAVAVLWSLLRVATELRVGAVLPFTFVIPLLVCVVTRRTGAVWVMAAAFVVFHAFEVFAILPPELVPGGRGVVYLTTLVNILVGAAAVHLIIRFRLRLERSIDEASARAAELAAQREELTRQNSRLMDQAEEVTRQSEEIASQSEELSEQNEELQLQFEEIQALNHALSGQEQLLRRLLTTVEHAESEEAALAHVADAALDVIGAPARVALLFTENGQDFHARAIAGTAMRDSPIEPDAFVRLALAQERTASLADRRRRPDLALFEDPRLPELRSVLCAPVATRTSGPVVLAVYGADPHDWTEEQFRLASWLAGEAAQVVQMLRLQDDLRRQAALVEISPDPILVRTPEGRILQWNAAAEALFGWSREEAVGRIAQDLLRSEYPIPMSAILNIVATTGTWVGDVAKHTKDGRRLIVQSSWSARRTAGGRVLELLESTMDVSARKAYEAELRDASQRKSEFLATLSHELRNPLAPMRYAIDLLAADRSARSAEPVRVLDRQLTHLVRLVDDLLDVTRITSNKIPLRKRRVNVSALVQEAAAALVPAHLPREHDFVVAAPSQPIWAEVDPDRIVQVVTNLVSNATRYTPQHGRIAVSVGSEGRDVTIAVADSGIGIRREDLPRVFEMFTQVSTPGTGGLGIGLALVKRIVELHGGTIEACSDGPGQGSRFLVRLNDAVLDDPRGDAAVAATAPSRPGNGQSRRVLVVDDNTDAADMMKAVLDLHGHDVRVAYDGLSALEAALQFAPEIALLDIGLPGLNGYEVAARLRESPVTRHVQLVAVTGWGHEQDRERARQAGFDAHLTKPADPDQVNRLVNTLGRES